jgi:membrane protein YqaA with SNARE-associated domain
VTGSSYELWSLFASAFISATLAPGGSEAVLAWLVLKTTHSHGLLLLIASLGNSLGAFTTWGLGRLAARGYPLERWQRKFGDSRAFDLVQRRGAPILLLSWLPVIGDALCFAAGWFRLPIPASLTAIVLGKIARYAVIIYLVR